MTCVAYMRAMYQTCRLVHGDLSEYNMLFYKGKLYIIDVSQSVEHDHPRSLEFLRMDVKNVRDFFMRKGVYVFSERETFDFITSNRGATEMSASRTRLEQMEKERESRTDEERERLEQEDEVFRQQYIPRTLEQVYDVERDVDQVQRGEGDSLIYRALLANKTTEEDAIAEADGEVDEGSSEGDGSEEHSDRFSDEDKRPRGHRFEDKDEKKARKQQVKDEKREARKNKMPKHLKKHIVASTARPKRR